MSHHSDIPFGDDLARKLGLGATGRYPRGKLCEHDEGEIKIGIAADPANGVVVIDFGKSVRSLGLTPDEAKDIADLLTSKAFECRGVTS